VKGGAVTGSNIRLASAGDIDAVERIYDEIHDAEESHAATVGWVRGVYPTRRTAEAALERDELFVEADDAGAVVAAAIINDEQVPEYANAAWRHEASDDEVLVLHTLVVSPSHPHKGYGRAFVEFYEQLAARLGRPELRIDTNERNVRARAMYARLGYEEVSIVPCEFNGIPDVQLVCLEKHLDDGDSRS
jgi:GNAT superfamily N-acetyltransferase